MANDAFISYSHAADDALAPALQHGLQSLARPWNRRRALEIFRDDTGLAVSPGLWSSITSALDESKYFVLLASPEAAASTWVNREIDHWAASHSVEHLLPVVTDGEWVWDSTGDFDWERSSAVPPALRGLFTEEPRHLDLRWAKGENELDLRNSRFREAVAQIAAPMHSMTPQDLESADVSHYRHVVRLRRAVVVALTVLLVLVSLAGILAVQNARDAQQAEAKARESAQEAEQQADRALAGQLLAQADVFRGREPTLSLLLSIEASKLTPDEAWTSLVDGLRSTSGLTKILDIPPRLNGREFYAIGPTGDMLAAPTSDGEVQLWDLRDGDTSGNQLAADDIYPESPSALVFSSSGALAGRYDCSRSGFCSKEEARHSHIVVRDPATGPPRYLPGSDGYTDPTFSPDGTHLAAFTADGRVRVWTTAGSIVATTRTRHGPPTGLALGRDGRTVAWSVPGTAGLFVWDVDAIPREDPRAMRWPAESSAEQVALGADALVVSRDDKGTVAFWDARSGRRLGGLSSKDVGRVVDLALGPDGTMATVDGEGVLQLWDTATSSQQGTSHSTGSRSSVDVEFTPDGNLVSVGDDVRLWNVPRWDESGSNLYRHRAPVTSLAVSDEGILASGDRGGVVAVSTLGPGQQEPQRFQTGHGVVTALAVSDSGVLATGGEGGTVRLWNLATTTMIDTFQGPEQLAVSAVEFSPDGATLAVGYDAGDPDEQSPDEGTLLWDVATGEVIPDLPAGFADDVADLAFSGDGTLGSAGRDDVTVWDLATLESRVVAPVRNGRFSAIAFSPDGAELASSGFETPRARFANVVLWDLTVVPPVGASLPTGGTGGQTGWDGRFPSLDYSPDGSLLVGAGSAGVQFWDTIRREPRGRLVGQSGATAAAVSRPDGAVVVVGYETGAVQSYPATTEGWRDAACAVVSRNLTVSEWTSVVGTSANYRKTCPQY